MTFLCTSSFPKASTKTSRASGPRFDSAVRITSLASPSVFALAILAKENYYRTKLRAGLSLRSLRETGCGQSL